jgi:dipeptidyl aminopeptidase/acylaminoacyl peptidase
MKNTTMKIAALIAALVIITLTVAGCGSSTTTTASGTTVDKQKTINMANVLANNQPTPYDISYSLERYNLIRRAYWVNGQREKANALVCEIEKPLGYIVLFAGNTIFGRFVVDGKVTSLNSYLTPDSEYYELVYGGTNSYKNNWLADVDGSYGENDCGIFFFTPDGKYVEWTGEYMYSDIPFTVDNPVVSWEAAE